MEYAWERPKDVTKDHSILTREEIQVSTTSQVEEFLVQILIEIAFDII